MNKIEWWESQGEFFGKYYKEADDSFEGPYTSSLDLEKRTKIEVDGVINLTGIKHTKKILDCPCGYGRHSIELAKLGYYVVGVDINDEFLKEAEEEKTRLKLSNCKFIKKDMRYLDFQNEFDLVINMFYSFGFFESDEDNEMVLLRFYNALVPGGKFLMHTHVTIPRLVSGKLKNFQIRQLKSGNKLRLVRKYNPETKREEGVWEILDKNDNVIKKLSPYSMRLYTDKEFAELCRKYGFKRVEIFGSWSGEKYQEESPLMIVVAEK